MKPTLLYDWQRRSNSHNNVLSEYNIFMTPRGGPSLDPKPPDPTSHRLQPQQFEYLTAQKPPKQAKNMPKSLFSGSKTPLEEKLMLIYRLRNGEKSLINSENRSINEEEGSLGSKSMGKASFDLNFPSSTGNKIRKLLMNSPYNNCLKSLKNLSQGSLLGEEVRAGNQGKKGLFGKQNGGLLTRFNMSRKKAAPMNKGVERGEKERKKETAIPEESTFKNSTSYKSTHNTSKSAERCRQSEDLFLLFNRAKMLLSQYKAKEKEWRKEKEDLLREIQSLRGKQGGNG